MAGLLGPVMGQQLAARLGLLDAPEESQQRDPRFWRGGEKVRGKDALAGLLAVIGDSASQLAGGQGGAIEGLLGGRSKALDEFKKRAEQERKMQQAIALGVANGMTEGQVRAHFAGLPEQRKPHVYEDNAGNLMEYDFASGRNRALSVDPQDRVYFNNGAMVTVPNMRRGMGETHTVQGEDLSIPLPTISNQKQYDMLSPGQEYTDPQGNRRRKGFR